MSENILDRVSEQDVFDWIEATLREGKKTVPELETVKLEVSDYKHNLQPVRRICLFGDGFCALLANSFSDGLVDLRDEVAAGKMRRESEEKGLSEAVGVAAIINWN